jgi:hypothetical protein
LRRHGGPASTQERLVAASRPVGAYDDAAGGPTQGCALGFRVRPLWGRRQGRALSRNAASFDSPGRQPWEIATTTWSSALKGRHPRNRSALSYPIRAEFRFVRPLGTIFLLSLISESRGTKPAQTASSEFGQNAPILRTPRRPCHAQCAARRQDSRPFAGRLPAVAGSPGRHHARRHP